LALGGYQGKGAFTFLAVLFLRYRKCKKVSIFEMQVGQIDSASNSAEILKPSMEKLEESINDALILMSREIAKLLLSTMLMTIHHAQFSFRWPIMLRITLFWTQNCTCS
jgi:hypothetical protein